MQQQLPSATSCFSPKLKGRGSHKQSGSVDNFFKNNAYYTLCAPIVHLSLQALSEKRARASLAGHSCPAALCSLAFSQGRQQGS